MKKLLMPATIAGSLLMTGCLTGQTMYGKCDPNGEPFGLDGAGPSSYVLHCDKGEWIPKMTAQEFVDLRQGKSVTIAPVPSRPVTTPAITTVGPSGLPLAGGAATVVGERLAGATEVTVGGVPAHIVSVADREIRIIAPAHGVGPVAVKVTTPKGTATLDNAVTYWGVPEVTSVDPDPVKPAETMTVRGTGFAPGSSILIKTGDGPDDRVILGATVIDATTLTFVVPELVSGPYVVQVRSIGGTSGIDDADAVFGVITD